MVGLAMAYYTLKYHEAIKMFEEIILYICTAMEWSHDILLMKMGENTCMVCYHLPKGWGREYINMHFFF